MNPQFPSVFYSCGEDGTVRFYDIRKAHNCGDDLEESRVNWRYRFLRSRSSLSCASSVLINLGYNVPIHSIAMNPIHPVHFVIGGEQKTLRCYDLRFLKSSITHGHNSDSAMVSNFKAGSFELDNFAVTGVAYSRDGTEILGSCSSENIYLFDSKNPESGSTQYDIPNFQRDEVAGPAPIQTSHISSKKFFSRHINFRTIKEVNFFGPNSEYVISGSDDGKMYIWQKNSKKLVKVLQGDEDVVNCVQPHPFKFEIASR
jgi:WD repeat-containing protein 42A